MTIEAIAALSNTAAPLHLSPTVAPVTVFNAPSAASPFEALVETMQNISSQMHVNQQGIEALAVGQGDELHRVIMNLESTKLTFDLALQVRNKVLDAYQELMRMQV